ncbi:MAG: hypothetical protein M4D80_01050 [Myxococcota bacterium]|nr:hypothetical protein [Deltaproteobacteria bacterium]MDQ3333742.1 hypothetical protein [Myxococcota bacterium]
MLVDPNVDPTMDLARPRAGSVDVWVRTVVVLAIAATLAVIISFPRVVWMRDHSANLPQFWFQNTLAIGFVTALVLAWLPAPRCSRFVRFAVLLPVLQVALMLGTWITWQLLKVRMPMAVDMTPLFEKLPVRVVLPWLAVTMIAGGTLVARRRREWLHATVMMSLVNLLLLGLWLPIASSGWSSESWNAWSRIDAVIERPASMVAFVVVPPFVGALVFTATALRWPQLWRRNNMIVVTLLVIGLVLGIACRLDVTEIGAFVYINFVHVLTSAALVAVAALLALGLSTWIGNARATRRLERGALVGTISSTHPVAALELTSWLRGLRATCDAFTVTTAFGDVPVPAGARVVMPAPLSSTLLRAGESIATLRPGDRVALAGYVHTTSPGPFRATSAPIPGADGITVRRVGSGDDRYGFAHVALDLWRPSVAYLVICVACALPALAGLLSDHF